MKDLLFHLKKYKKECVLGPLFKLLEATFELFIPLVVASIIDGGINKNNKSYVVIMCIIMALLGLIGLISSVTAQYFAAKAAVGSTTGLRSRLFKKIQSLSFTNLDKLGTSTMITRLVSDTNQVQTGVNLTLRLLLRSPFVVFGAMIMAMTVDMKSTLIFALVIALLSVVVFGIMLIGIPLYKKVQSKLDTVLHSTRENLLGVRVIRAFGKEKDEQSAFEEDNTALTKIQKFVGRISSLMNPVTYIIVNLGIIVLIYTGALRVNSGDLSSGEVVALYNYMSQILVELVKLASFIITITKSVACANRISAVINITETQVNGSKTADTSNNTAVTFDNVSLMYDGASEETLTDISFSVNKGQTVGIIGGTGSGKTSLVNLIPAFYRATNGQVKLFDTDVLELTKESLCKTVAVVPQKALLFSGTIRQNLLWGNENATDADLLEAVKTAQALDVLEAKGGLDSMIEQGGKNLSGGQRQRLTIARALVKKSPVLILDDSASALDLATDARLRASLRSLKDTTVFIVSQRTSSIKHADKIIVLDDGKVAGIGAHDELLSSCDVYREIFESQHRKESVK